MIVIIDYGMGNLGSILNMCRFLNIEASIEDDVESIKNAKKIILPGVGSFDTAMERIKKNGLQDVLNKKALEEKIPFLGICLGMQLLTNRSQEGSLPGLGWIDAEAIKFPENRVLKVPHVGWNEAKPGKSDPMVKGLLEDSRFYFVHSYFVKTNNSEHSLMKTNYGITFDSAISKDNIYGFQFHPEKSHKYGMKILKNFSEIMTHE